jgi:sentrin-specific protease 1
MGILGRYDRRKARDRVRLKHHLHPAKHRFPTKAQSLTAPFNNNSLSPSPMNKAQSELPKLPSGLIRDAKPLINDTNSQQNPLIHVDESTAIIIRNEVMGILNSSSDHSCTVLEMANALAQSQACLESHSKIREKHQNIFSSTSIRKLRQNAKLTFDWTANSKTKHLLTQPKNVLSLKFLGRSKIFSRKIEKESMRSRYQWVDALNRLEKYPSSREQTVSTWEEAKKCLEEIIFFPPDEETHPDQNLESSPMHLLSSVEKQHRETLEAEIEIVQGNVNSLSVSNSKWKKIASYPDQQQLKAEEEENLETLLQKESIDKADLYFNARIRTAEELAKQLQQSETVRKLEERRIASEGAKRASLLMRALNEDERKIVESAIHGFGHGDEIVAQAGADSVQRASMKTLKPGMWLNDEIIHYFYLMLAKRDEELCKNDPSRKRSHFFKSFFITKLLNEGNVSCDGKYEYRNVKRWSKKVPGKDIFNLDKILFPINMGNMHWICAAIFMKKKRIEVFDSMGSNGNRYLDALFTYIQDEHMDKKKIPLPDADAWEIVPTQPDTPRQTNGMFLRKIHLPSYAIHRQIIVHRWIEKRKTDYLVVYFSLTFFLFFC